MKITVLRRTEYKGCPVYILRLGIIFQYLFIFENELYQDHMYWKPRWFVRFAAFFRFRPLYTKDEQEEGEGIILNGALSSIDILTDPEKFKEIQKKRAEDKKLCQLTSTNAESAEAKSAPSA